jgi:WD40 repeat protein
VLVSGGLDGTVRIWVDVNEDDDAHVNGLTEGHETGITPPGEGDEGVVEQLRIENSLYGGGDTEGDRASVAGEETPTRGGEGQTEEMES